MLKKETRVFESVSVPSCAPEVKRGNLSLNAWCILLEVGIKTRLGNMSLFPTYRRFLLTLFNTRAHTESPCTFLLAVLNNTLILSSLRSLCGYNATIQSYFFPIV